MECRKCGERLRTVRTFDVAGKGRTRELACSCGARYTHVDLFFCEIKGRGTGAYAVAQRLRRGELPIATDDQEKTNHRQ